ncbi:MAG: PDZ domain-containing protein [Elusimicrobiota bacterium]
MRKKLLPLPLVLFSVCALALASEGGAVEARQGDQRPGGWLGLKLALSISPELRKDLTLPPDLNGLLVLGVFSGTPAQDCGLAVGDVLAKIDGESLSDIAQIKAKGAGARVKFEVYRDAAARPVTCTLGAFTATLGMQVSNTPSGPRLESFPGIEKDKGMRKLGWPAQSVYIRSLDGQPMKDISQIKAALARLKPYDMASLELYSAKKNIAMQVKLGEGDPPPMGFLLERPASGRAPRTLVVSADGKGDYLSPLGALLRSGPGDTLLLRAGRYAEPITVFVSRRTLRGEGEATVLTGMLWLGGVRDVTVEDLSLEQKPGVPDIDTTLWVLNASDVVLRRLNVSGGRLGIAVQSSKDVSVEDCRARKAVVGLLIHGSQAKVLRSLFHDNGDGVIVSLGSTATLRSLTVVDNRSSGVTADASRIELYDSILAGSPTLLKCQSDCGYSGGYNDYSEGSMSADLMKNTDIALDPLFAERLKGDYRLSLESPLIGRGRGGGHIGALPPAGAGAGADGFR